MKPSDKYNSPMVMGLCVVFVFCMALFIICINMNTVHKTGASLPTDVFQAHRTNPGSPQNGLMPHMHIPLLKFNNKLTAEISPVFIHNKERIELGKVLGQGNFGCVYAGKIRQYGFERQVAVKSLLQDSRPTLNDISNFLREGIMMKDLKHPNVLALIGISFDYTNMPLIVLPFMKNGDILTFVRNPSNAHVLTTKQLVEFCCQIAEGMMYLSSCQIVHRDLAARNCMLDENMVVKIADFGMSRGIHGKNYYSAKDRTAGVPVRWMAMECLERNIYDTSTDVWSFGVVMWEILTKGCVPYFNIHNNEDVFRFLKRGDRLSKPLHCPNLVYLVMLWCWSENPRKRPSFQLLVSKLKGILMAMASSDDPTGQPTTT